MSKTRKFFIQLFLAFFLLNSGTFVMIAHAKTQTINLVKFNSNFVPEEFYKPKPVAKQPLPIKDIIKMKKGGVDEDVIRDSIENRKVVGGSGAETLVALKKAGLGKNVLKAVSRYALPKNNNLDIEFTLEFIKPSLRANPRYLYVIFHDGNFDRIIYADLEIILQGKWKYDDVMDMQDPVLAKRIRTIRFFGNIALKKHGKVSMKVVLSKKPNIRDIKELSETEIKEASVQEFDYPAYSLLNDCRLKVELKSDIAIADKWKVKSSLMSCEFN